MDLPIPHTGTKAGRAGSLPEIAHWDTRQWDQNQDGLTLPLKVLPGFRDGMLMRPGMQPDPHLVVDNHMHGAVGGVRGQVTQVEGLIDHTLAGEGSIPMDQDGHDLQSRG